MGAAGGAGRAGRAPITAARRDAGDRSGPRRLARRLLPRPRVLAALVVLAAVLVGAWLWVRDSSLVAVERVRVAGVSGPDGAEIRSALISAARDMTTLDVKLNQLRLAVAPYPAVKHLNVNTQFPHGMRIQVSEQVAVAVADAGGRRTEVSGDGTLLHDAVASSNLPTIPLGVPPGGTHLSGDALLEGRLLGAAPYQLLPQGEPGIRRLRPRAGGAASQTAPASTSATRVSSAPSGPLRRGPGRPKARSGATYIDVTDPGRPVAGAVNELVGEHREHRRGVDPARAPPQRPAEAKSQVEVDPERRATLRPQSRVPLLQRSLRTRAAR